MALIDILPKTLTKNNIRVIVNTVFSSIEFSTNRSNSTRPVGERSRTPSNSKNLIEFYGLVKNVIDDMRSEEHTSELQSH